MLLDPHLKRVNLDANLYVQSKHMQIDKTQANEENIIHLTTHALHSANALQIHKTQPNT